MRLWQLAVLWSSLIATAACDDGFVRDQSQMGSTIIGAYLARNAGTGLVGNIRADGRPLGEQLDSAVLQRLLELAHAGRAGAPDTTVNEAVAIQSGYVCEDYRQLQPAMRGCSAAEIPIYSWKSAEEVRHAAQDIGFSCAAVSDDGVECEYSGKITQHPVKFALSPSIDGVRSGNDKVYQNVARLHYLNGKSPIMDVTESTAR